MMLTRLVTSILIAMLALPAHAQPALDEYTDVKPGLMMPEGTTPTQPENGQEIKVSTVSQGAQQVRTMEEIVGLYKQGKFEQAAKFLEPFANNGQHQAEELLGIMYRAGQGVQKDPQKAITLLSRAAEANRPLAQHHLGIAHYLGDGVTQDPVKGLMWLYIAIAHYPDGAEKRRAVQDRDGINAQLSRRDKERAFELAREWLDKKNEAHLLERPQ